MKSIKIEEWQVLPRDIQAQMANIADNMREACQALADYETALKMESPKLPHYKKCLYDALTNIENSGSEFVFFK